jgi:hypothetical protein
MKSNRIMLSAAAIIIALTTSTFGQDRKPISADEQSQYVVSARAGAVNATEGTSDFKRGRSDWDPLIAGDDLRAGDTVRTGDDGLVEVLLNPGSFLRLAPNSEFVFSSTSTHHLRLKINRGTAIVEASAIDAPITVKVGDSTEFSIARAGLYRFVLEPDGRALATVRKGRIEFGGKKVKDGKMIIVGANQPVIASFDKKVEDEFDLWSKGRSRALIAANKRLSQRIIRRSVSLAWGGNLWLHDPGYGYTFLPYGRFRSPYGGGYQTCNPYYNSWRNYGNGNSGGGYAGGGSGGGYSGGGSGGRNTGGGGAGVGRSGGSAPSSSTSRAGGRIGGGADSNPTRAKQ